jgi:hypothetical protein
MANSGAALREPKYHGELVDGSGNRVGLMIADGRGKDAPEALRRTPYPRTSTRIAQGATKYGDYELPYRPIEQENWASGRGSPDFEADVARYLDAGGLNTEHENQVILGGQVTYCWGESNYLRKHTFSLPGSVSWQGLYSTQRFIAATFVPSAVVGDYGADYAEIWLRKVGSPTGNMQVDIYTDVAGAPGASVASALLSVATGISDVLSLFFKFDWSSTTPLVAGTTYHLVVGGAAGWTSSACVEVGCNASAAGHKSSDGSAWSASTFSPYYRVADAAAHIPGRLFEYKRGLYFISMPDDGAASSIWISGDRGVADSNAGNLDKLLDATMSGWVAGDFDGATVLIINGPGSEESQPWRTITATAAGALTVSPNWKIAHTTATEYVILGANRWELQYSLSNHATDLAVAGELIFVAFGDDANIQALRQFRRGATWTQTNAAMNYGAEKLLAIQHPTLGHILWGADNAHALYNRCVSKAIIPTPPPPVLSTCDLYTKLSTLVDGSRVWDERVVTNITVSKIDNAVRIAANGSFTTGDMASRALDTPVDITGATGVGVLIRSDVATTAGQLKLVLDDTARLGKSLALLQACVLDKGEVLDVLTWLKVKMNPSASFFYDTSATTYFELDSLADGLSFTRSLMPLETTDYWYVGYDMRFHTLTVDVASANAAASVLTAEIWDGYAWTAVTITDGTISGGKTLGKDGDITLTVPVNWQRGAGTITQLDSNLFWIRFKVSANLTATTALGGLTLDGNGYVPSEARHYIDLHEVNDDSASASRFTLRALGRLYVGHNKRFNVLDVDIETANAVAASQTAYYWDGQSWVSLSITDNTASGGAPFAVDGTITFTAPADWEPGTGSPESGQLDQTKYYIYLQPTLDLGEVGIRRLHVEGPDIENYVDLPRAYDGDSGTSAALSLQSDDYLIAVCAEKFNILYVDMTAGGLNNEAATMAVQYWNGQAWTTLTVTDGTLAGGTKTLGQDGSISFTIPEDWATTTVNGVMGYAVRMKPSADLKTSTPSIFLGISEMYAQMDDETTVDIPALNANEWAFVQASISPNANPNPDESNIVSVGLRRSANLGAQNVDIVEVMAIDVYPRYIPIPDRITALEAYGDQQENPRVFTDNLPYEIQTENNDLPVVVPPRELSGMRSEVTGQAHTVNDVYLYFNLDTHIERYYNRSLEDIGPDRDEGLPSDRQGQPVALLTYPGRVFALIDAGTSGYSSILLRKGSGWHEVYRAPLGERIFAAAIQVIPGMVTRLWVNQGADLVWVPLPKTSFNPLRDSNYRYRHEGYLVTGWISAGFLDIEKLFKSIKLFTENLGANQYIQAQYQEETGALGSGWTNVVSTHATSPFQEVNLAAANNVTARRIRFRLIFYTNSNTTTPVLKAQVVETLLRFPVKYQYDLPCRFMDHNSDLQDRQALAVRAETDMAQIDAWANAPTVLTFTNIYSPYDVKTVVVEPPGCKPFRVNPGDQEEGHLVNITLLEI